MAETLKLGPFLRRGFDEVAKLTPADVQPFLNKVATGLSPRRVQAIHAELRRALVTAERWGSPGNEVTRDGLATPWSSHAST